MRLRLFVVHGSHPCAAVEKALDIKGLEYRLFEWPPPLHVLGQRMIFGVRTVPGLQIDGERIAGSRKIMRRLDELQPQPPLYPADPERRAQVEAAERWGDEVFQPVARELIWAGMLKAPHAMVSYAKGSRVPLPAPAIRASAPLIARVERRLNRTSDEVARSDVAALPAQLEQIDAWIANGTIGDAERPNAADLQILSTVRLLMTVEDVLPLIEDRPCDKAARALFPQFDGHMPAGVLRVSPAPATAQAA